MKNRVSCNRYTGGRRGFSLVVVISMMVLLAMVSLGILGISATVIRTSSRELPLQEARANARLAMQLAISRLQENLGPDQRVSATANLLADRRSIKENHWVGVWKTTDDEEEGASFWQRTSRDGGLTDTRFFDGSNWQPEDEVTEWLVSGNEKRGLRFEPGEGAGPVGVTLVGGGSVVDLDADGVRVPRVALYRGSGSTEPYEDGGYAWWVGDLGCRANVGTPDRQELAGRGDEGKKYQRLVAQDAELWEETIEPEERLKLVDDGTLDLQGLAIREHFHDYTTRSLGVLCNTREGGLQRDLTWFLNNQSDVEDLKDGTTVISAGLAAGDRMLGPANNAEAIRTGQRLATIKPHLVAPQFDVLRQWVQQSQGEAPAREVIFSAREPHPGEMADAYDSSNPSPVAIKELAHHSVRPVLVEGSIYYGISYYLDPNAQGMERRYRLRIHIYPRVVLWNPYNVALKVPSTALGLFINGAKEIEVTYQDGSSEDFKMYLGRTNKDERTGGGKESAQMGTLYFHMSEATIPAGESFVFSPPAAQPYDERSISNNRLVPGSPATDKGYFLSLRPDAGKDTQVFNRTRPVPGADESIAEENGSLLLPVISFREIFGVNQAHDYRMMWKHDLPSRSWTPEDFDSFPMAQFVSCALQYGDNRELPVVWAENFPVPVEGLDAVAPVATLPPDRRTRDGFRMRWFRETQSNQIGSGVLSGTPHFEDAQMANWNVRGSYSLRTPWENVTDTTPAFFGNYTRDLFDDAVSWLTLQPFGHNTFPFGTPSEGPTKMVLFELPDEETGILSLAAFQHANMSEFMWAPSYAIGNSLADPRINDTRGTELESKTVSNREDNGWNRYTIGWDDSGKGRSDSQTSWANYAKYLLQNIPSARGENTNVLYDLSYELNQTLFDRFFLSTGDDADKRRFARDPSANPLPNGRMRLLHHQEAEDRVRDFHLAASVLMMDGMFNVNSTSVEAWKAVISSGRGTEPQVSGEVPFGRLIEAPEGYSAADNAGSNDSFAGARALDEAEITHLAEAIVTEVKARGPFLSLSDFVNRRLSNDEFGKKGALQAAIDRSGLNRSFETAYPLDNQTELPDFWHPDNIRDATRLEQELKPATVAWGLPGYLTQADLLQVLAPGLSARSDTFVIRAYGDAKSRSGKVLAQAWCEATVQRWPEPMQGDAYGLNPKEDDEGGKDWGRRFRLISFRWMKPEEI
ncbi:MAG: hypothetical protein Q7Q71_12500 [Verrucomicrobiota bacterium JB023]|nr:hypothetical protein [Verrucomicrobiota bacterium JB023]